MVLWGVGVACTRVFGLRGGLPRPSLMHTHWNWLNVHVPRYWTPTTITPTRVAGAHMTSTYGQAPLALVVPTDRSAGRLTP